ncbi:MAG TPA: S9 family peptidase [Planctomycetales bacterium]|nr:S9 family peptidase [Planctomycetales bacterium]
MTNAVVIVAGLMLLAVPAVVQAEGGKRPLNIDDLFAFKRVSDPQISPDGKTIVYVVGEVDLSANKTSSSLWLAAADGKGEPRRLTNAVGKKDSHPRWSPDGKQILFESNRSGDGQLWLIDVDGGEGQKLTAISTEAGNAVWSRDGANIAFVSAVYPEYSEKPFKEADELNKKRKEEAEKNPVKAKVFTRLFYRHWDSYVEDKRQHLFVMSAAGGEPKDATPGNRDAFPTSSTFSTGDNFTFSPDGKYLVFTAVPEKDEAWNTNYSICRVPVTGGTTQWECLTKDNPAASSGPLFSPDGKMVAYRAQQRAGFEADKWDLMLARVDRSGGFQEIRHRLTVQFHGSTTDFAWYAGGVALTAEENGLAPVFFTYSDGGGVFKVTEDGTYTSLTCDRHMNTLALTRVAMSQPAEVFCARRDQDAMENPVPINVSHANDKLLAELDMPHPESVKVKVEGAEMQMWILKPPGFDPKKKWPLVFFVHGGPQGAWEDGWSNRWNPELWAAQGYIVALPNPRGSTGFGQKFTDEISGDWGGKCYDDLMAGLAYMEKQDYIDTDRMAAAGASFGGYMMNWFEGHTTKFKTLITHCGVYNFDSMYATTDEIWFDEWEHGGKPWDKDKREAFEKFSPHRYADKFQTPMLIIHNDLDFRVPVGEGLQLFNTLQRKGIPSKFINFPDEGHWVAKPKNSEYWHKEVFAWLAKYAPPGGK